MKEIRQILSLYKKTEGQNGVLLTVVQVEGSSYRRIGARMYLAQNGEWAGGVSGGCLEADALKKAQIVLFQNKPRILIYDTTNDDPMQIGVGLGCNGIIQILVSPIIRTDKNNALEQLNKLVDLRQNNFLLTILNEEGLGETFLKENFDLKFNKNSFKESGKSKIIELETVDNQLIRVLYENIKPTVRLLIFGSNADVQPLIKIASELGWLIEVIGNANKIPAAFKALLHRCHSKGDCPEVDDFTVAISMCHDFESDFFNFNYLLKSKVKYIGILGPKKRFEKMITRHEVEGNQDLLINLNHVYAPSGLDIGAETPEEIALSICAEIITVLSKRNAGFLKNRTLPIYED